MTKYVVLAHGLPIKTATGETVYDDTADWTVVDSGAAALNRCEKFKARGFKWVFWRECSETAHEWTGEEE